MVVLWGGLECVGWAEKRVWDELKCVGWAGRGVWGVCECGLIGRGS